MRISKYIDVIIRYYNLSTITFGSADTKRKKTNIQISKKISLSGIIFWIIMSILFTVFAISIDPINTIKVSNSYQNIHNSKWWIYIIIAIVIMVLTIIKSLMLFKKIEHKPLNLNIYQREKPSNLRPAHVRLLLNDGLVDSISLSATLLDLIDRGYLSIEKYESIKENIFKDKDVILRKTEKKMDNLLKFEKFIIEWFIDKYGDGKEISMKEIKNRLKATSDEESPSELFENWIGLVFLSFPLKKFYEEYRNSKTNKNILYLVLTILGIFPIIPYVRNSWYIWVRLLIICITNIYIE